MKENKKDNRKYQILNNNGILNNKATTKVMDMYINKTNSNLINIFSQREKDKILIILNKVPKLFKPNMEIDKLK